MSTSKLQRYTGSKLRRRFSKYGIVENTRPSWLISTKGERLELDFYLERLGIAIEVQGEQHFKFTPIFHASEWDFQEQLRRDRDKLEVCQRAGIDLLYVCKKSDVELVLTACYDAVKPRGTNSPAWTSTAPAWLLGRQKMKNDTFPSKSKHCKNDHAIQHRIQKWEDKLLQELKLKRPRRLRVAKIKRKIREWSFQLD